MVSLGLFVPSDSFDVERRIDVFTVVEKCLDDADDSIRGREVGMGAGGSALD